MVRSPDGDTDVFDNLAEVLQGDSLAPYILIIFPDFVLQPSIDLMKVNGFDVVLLTNTHGQNKSIQYNLEQAAKSIGLYVNANEIEFMCLKQEGVEL